MKTAQGIEELSQVREESKKATGRGTHPNSIKNLKPYVPGQCGNPGGKPAFDHAQAIARAIFENDSEAIYAAFVKALRAGNAYSFDVLANRAFGKMKETVVHEGLEALADKLNDIRRKKNADTRSA